MTQYIKVIQPAPSITVLWKGDIPGHEFHGNQYTGGQGGSGEGRESGVSPDFELTARRMVEAGSQRSGGVEWSVSNNVVAVNHWVTGRDYGTIDLKTGQLMPVRAEDRDVLQRIKNEISAQENIFAKEAELTLLQQYPIRNAERIRQLEKE